MLLLVTRSTRLRRRQRGSIDELPSGALRVRVYAGTDPVSKRRNYLTEVVPAGPKAGTQADAARVRLLSQLDERRNPRTNATVNQLLDKYLDVLDAGASTLRTYRGYLDMHVRPFVGALKVGALGADTLDSLYAEMRRCRRHCTGRRRTDHRADGKHACDHRCRQHVCRPLAASSVRQIHFVLSGAYKRAVRWQWVATSPIQQAVPPSAPQPQPHPPSADDAARILQESWRDPDWGTLVWLTMTTGARRGELCGLRWRDLDLVTGVAHVHRSIAQVGADTEDKDTKTHQQRRVALDPETVTILAEHWERCQARVNALDLTISRDGFVFSLAPDNSTHLLPDTVTQRYGRLATRLGIDTHLHSLRHYSATELITAGVDIRTVAGRLGHGGGGATTLRVYAAWVSESDQRAAASLFSRMPTRPASRPPAAELAKTAPRNPYEKIAAELRRGILDGTISPGEPIPTAKQLAGHHGVAVGTAHRAITLLKTWDLIEVSRGRRAVVRPIA